MQWTEDNESKAVDNEDNESKSRADYEIAYIVVLYGAPPYDWEEQWSRTIMASL